jgi:hypothetical protein
MIKNILFFIFTFITIGFSETTTDQCFIVKDYTTRLDTMMTISCKGSILNAITNTQMRALLESDATADECLKQLDSSRTILNLYKERTLLSDSVYKLQNSSQLKYEESLDTLKKIIVKTDTIVTGMDSIISITNEKLKRCEDGAPSFWERLIQMGASAVVGMLIGIIIMVD